MSWVLKNKALRKAAYSFAVVGLATAGLWFGAQTNTTEANTNNLTLASAPAATFAPDAGTLGGIPDGPGTPTLCGSDGAPRNVTFTVAGLGGAPTNVVASLTFGGPVHTFAGDIKAILIAPNGTSHSLFGRPLATTSAACGDASDLAGPYTFSDAAAAPPSGGWWQAATAETTSTAPIASGTYRTTNSGGAGAVNPQPPTSMNTAFAGVTNPNGTWTLRLLDGGGGDTGAVSAANLTIDAGTPTPTPPGGPRPLDFDGNGRTDFTTVRNTGGGSGGQVTWFINYNAGAGSVAYAWGLASDFFVSGDFDADNKADVVVWRPGAPGVAAYYILQSATSTVRIDVFGQTGDDPTVVGDYDGDNRDDVAVYRAGATAGAQSTWFFRGSSANPGGNITFVPWGQNGDFPAPGDYDGNGRNDYVIQRNAGGGQAAFWTLLSTGATSVKIHGTPTDVIVPGDYDGDGKTDIATIRGSAGSINWYYQSSINNATISGTWGASATDFPTQGDYDGDGKTDFAVWRPSATAGQSAFYAYGSTSGPIIAPWGANGDYPAANFNSH